MNTRSGRLMILGFMLLFFAFVLTFLLQVLVNALHLFFPEWAALMSLCVAVIVIAALAGIVVGVRGLLSDN